MNITNYFHFRFQLKMEAKKIKAEENSARPDEVSDLRKQLEEMKILFDAEKKEKEKYQEEARNSQGCMNFYYKKWMEAKSKHPELQRKLDWSGERIATLERELSELRAATVEIPYAIKIILVKNLYLIIKFQLTRRSYRGTDCCTRCCSCCSGGAGRKTLKTK